MHIYHKTRVLCMSWHSFYPSRNKSELPSLKSPLASVKRQGWVEEWLFVFKQSFLDVGYMEIMPACIIQLLTPCLPTHWELFWILGEGGEGECYGTSQAYLQAQYFWITGFFFFFVITFLVNRNKKETYCTCCCVWGSSASRKLRCLSAAAAAATVCWFWC